jgi:hypothetical protein
MLRCFSALLTCCCVLVFVSDSHAQELLPGTDREFTQKVLDDIGITEADLMQFGVNMSSRMQEMTEKFEERFKEPPTSKNYREYIGQAIDECGIPISSMINEELRDFFTPEQYQKIQTRLFQLTYSAMNAAENDGASVEEVAFAGAGGMATFLGPPDFLNFTDEQRKQLLELQKETALDLAGVVIPLEEEVNEKRRQLNKQLQEATTDKEREEIRKQQNEIRWGDEVIVPKIKPVFMKAWGKFKKIFTDKQKAKIEEVMAEMPDYLWGALPGNKGKERPWRPGPDSWRPGMGVPKDLGDAPREAKPTPRPEGGRRFPGQDE